MSAAAIANSTVFQPGPLTSFFHERRTDLSQLGQALQSGDLTGAQTAYNTLATLSQNGSFSGSATNPFRNTQRSQDFATIGQDLQNGDLTGAQAAYADLVNSFRKHPANTPAESGAGPAITITITGGNGNSATENTTNTATTGTSATSNSTDSNTATSPITSTVGTTPSTTTTPTTTPNTTTTPSTNPASGPEIVLNLNNGTGSNTPEIVLNFGSGSGSTSSTPATATPGEVILNLGNTSNEQVTINLSENASGGEQVGISVNPTSSGTSNHGEQITLNVNNTNDQIVLNFLNASTTPASTQNQNSGLNVTA
ncbi:MAG TPA: hypothetical protein VFA74_04275 [Terriglobales bacterium]|nr:hypothetical protein [Terriglobales bacterium]